MAISLGFTNLDNGDTAGNWSAEGSNVTNIANQTDFVEKRGAAIVGFRINTAYSSGKGSGVTLGTTFTSVDIRSGEIQIWFMNPYADAANARLLHDYNDAVVLRVKSGANWADYYQGHLRLGDGEYPGGWMLLRASGDAGTEDDKSATWTSTQAGAVDNVAVMLKVENDNGNKTSQPYDTPYGVNWLKYVQKINIDGYDTGSTDWTMQDIVDQDLENNGTTTGDDGEWGCVTKEENFFRSLVPFEFGTGSAAGGFTSENEYIYFDHSSVDFECDMTISNLFECTFGKKDDDGGSGTNYAVNGVQLVVKSTPIWGTGTPRPELTVASGGLLNLYATLVRGWGTINLGSNGTAAIEMIKADFYDNTTIEMRTTGLSVENSRFHKPGAATGALGAIYSLPSKLEVKEVFNVTDAFDIRVTGVEITEYIVSDATYHVVINEGKTVTLIDSTFDATKMKRST